MNRRKIREGLVVPLESGTRALERDKPQGDDGIVGAGSRIAMRDRLDLRPGGIADPPDSDPAVVVVLDEQAPSVPPVPSEPIELLGSDEVG